MYYEAAWAWRAIAEQEVATTRTRLQQEKQKQLQAEADKKAAPGTKAPQVHLPEIARAAVPLQPAEGKHAAPTSSRRPIRRIAAVGRGAF